MTYQKRYRDAGGSAASPLPRPSSFVRFQTNISDGNLGQEGTMKNNARLEPNQSSLNLVVVPRNIYESLLCTETGLDVRRTSRDCSLFTCRPRFPEAITVQVVERSECSQEEFCALGQSLDGRVRQILFRPHRTRSRK